METLKDMKFWKGWVSGILFSFLILMSLRLIILLINKNVDEVSHIEKQVELVRAKVFSNDTVFVRETSREIDSLMRIIDCKVRSPKVDHNDKLLLFEIRQDLDLYRTCNSAQESIMDTEIAMSEILK